MFKLARDIPFLRGFTYQVTPYHVGSVFENRLGLQVLRTISKFLLWKARKPHLPSTIKAYVQTLEREGILVFENYLNQQQFDEVKSEFEKTNENIQLLPYKGDKGSKLHRSQLSVSEFSEKCPSIIKNFQNSAKLNAIASATTRRRIRKLPDVFLDTYQNLNDNGFDNDIENILHADLHTATIKMFFYLNDVDETNGAFVYAKGSHKLTVRRLKHEYEFSIRQAKIRTGQNVADDLMLFRGKEFRNTINPKHRHSMNIVETPLCVKANTLVIANNMGFHRRGEFSSSAPRKAILINYRYLERPVG